MTPSLSQPLNHLWRCPNLQLKKVAQICSVDQLTCDGEDMLERKLKVDTDLDGKSNFPNLPDMSLPLGEDIDEQAAQVLESLKTRKRRQNIIKRRTAVAKMLFGTLRFSSEVRLESDEASKPARRHGLRPGSTTEPVITVRVYQPPAASTTVGSCLSWFNMSQEVACLGSNRLTQLRDVITCPEDQLVTNDCSVAPRGTPRQQAKSMYPSGFFCINRVFYVDQRDPKHIDYSEPIRKWAAAQLAGDLPTRSMEDVCFSGPERETRLPVHLRAPGLLPAPVGVLRREAVPPDQRGRPAGVSGGAGRSALAAPGLPGVRPPARQVADDGPRADAHRSDLLLRDLLQGLQLPRRPAHGLVSGVPVRAGPAGGAADDGARPRCRGGGRRHLLKPRPATAAVGRAEIGCLEPGCGLGGGTGWLDGCAAAEAALCRRQNGMSLFTRLL
ncbi:uncharacterized protein LOC119103843 [Pollicipes pollicipes]|uniref:uncharacterized protein LOC119103843 n=1 Tax=Pollicipes pollicipes TaxID=41117 RepID=UPI0018855038|nr:uncharacterized protein LOC119103843 [Pollicipes pollicipes]